jgi:hypothetical protein
VLIVFGVGSAVWFGHSDAVVMGVLLSILGVFMLTVKENVR